MGNCYVVAFCQNIFTIFHASASLYSLKLIIIIIILKKGCLYLHQYMPLFNYIYQLSPLRETKLHVSYYMITPQYWLFLLKIPTVPWDQFYFGRRGKRPSESYSPAAHNNPTSHSPLQCVCFAIPNVMAPLRDCFFLIRTSEAQCFAYVRGNHQQHSVWFSAKTFIYWMIDCLFRFFFLCILLHKSFLFMCDYLSVCLFV